MTPARVKEIFGQRGFHAAMATAQACGHGELVELVKQLGKESNGGGKTARRRASGALARQKANREMRAAENRARSAGKGSGGGKKKH